MYNLAHNHLTCPALSDKQTRIYHLYFHTNHPFPAGKDMPALAETVSATGHQLINELERNFFSGFSMVVIHSAFNIPQCFFACDDRV